MPRWFNKFADFILLRKRLVIKTKRSKDDVLNRIEQIADNSPETMLWKLKKSGFTICEKYTETFTDGYFKNSFAPVVKAKLLQDDGATVIKGAIRPSIFTYLLYLPFHIASVCLIITIPITLIITRAFYERASILYEKLEYLLLED